MESSQLNRIAFAAVLTLFTGTFAFGQCKATKVDYDPVDISELGSFQKQKTAVETSDNYIDMFYLVMATKSTGYRLVITRDGFYTMTKGTKEDSSEEISSGVLKIADMEKLNDININEVTHFLGKCKGITGESAEIFLVKKIGAVKIYSLDGELERTLKENQDETKGMAYFFELLNLLINGKVE